MRTYVEGVQREVAAEVPGQLVFLNRQSCHSMAHIMCQEQDIRPVLHCDVVEYVGAGVGVEDGGTGVPSCSSFTFFAAGVDIE